MNKCLTLFVMVLCTGMSHADQQVRFSVDVLPILSEHCFSCHGPDEKHRKGGLRLDDRDAAIKSGAIVPGKPLESELLKRIHSADTSEVMPPPKFNKKLSELQTRVLEKWLAQGAPWGKHWAFEAPQKATLPKVSDQSLKNPIDLFVGAKLQAMG
ncbi:MAG: c-type cytochrome domain-containing protein, partial [Planctomycetia bacterium]